MATNKVRIGSLDFDTIKQSLVDYLNTQGTFTDHNFEGSGLSTLVNVLAYNAHYDSLAANFLANEMFLDTAQKRSSVVSHAKALGYTARSKCAASAVLELTFYSVANASTTSSIVVPQGAKFSANINDQYFTFTSMTSVALPRSVEGGEYIFRGNVTVYEGLLSQQTSTYNSVAKTIQIQNVDMDTSTLQVKARAQVTDAWEQHSLPSSFLNLTSTSNVYFINEGFNGYDVSFGDGVFGKQLTDGSQVQFLYVTTSGSAGNGAKVFNSISTIAGTEGSILKISSLNGSLGGLDAEDIESIRSNATLQYGTQNRAVVASDYSAITLQNFPFVKDCLAWDGADNVPPKFGKVVLCVQPNTGDTITVANQAAITSLLSSKSVANVKIEYVSPDYIDVVINTNIKYDKNSINISTYELEYAIKMAIYNFAKTNIFKFGSKFRYSSLVKTIDNTNTSIISNVTNVTLLKTITPNLYASNNFSINFGNEIVTNSFISTKFYDSTSSNALYVKDDGNGKINIVYDINGLTKIFRANAGTISYNTGAVKLNNITISSLGTTALKLNFFATPIDKDLKSIKNIILNLSTEYIDITLIPDVI